MNNVNQRLIDACEAVLDMPAACTTDEEVRSNIVRREYMKFCVAQAKIFVHESIEEPFICKMTMTVDEACKFCRKNVARICFVQGIDWDNHHSDELDVMITFAPAPFMQNVNVKETA